MKRYICLFFSVLAVLASAAVAEGAASKRPNILFFFADDWGRHAGVYRDSDRPSLNDVVQTPQIDRIGREGVVFENAFMPVSQCTPCRASISSGAYFWRCGKESFLKGGDWRGKENPFDALPKFGDLLGDAGYFMSKSWKTITFTESPARKRGKAMSTVRGFLRFGLHLSEASSRQERDSRRLEVIAQTREAIRGVLDECPPDQPFFYVFGPINTHRPYAKGSGQQLWNIQPDQLKGRLPAFLPDVPEIRSDLADYLGEVQALDLMLGVMIEELEKAGKLDETLVVLTGDNGVPGVPRGKCNVYDIGIQAPLMVRWPGRVKAGRRVADFVNLMDLAPTFLDAAGVTPPGSMDGRSVLPQLLADGSGQIDPKRDAVFLGRERHIPDARPGNQPYPSRAIRTKDFLYIRNFKADRWPMGNPWRLDTAEEPGEDELATSTMATITDLDASPTKAWLISNRKEGEAAASYRLTLEKRPAEELYDLRKDPDQMVNLAEDPGYAKVKQGLSVRLMRVLEETNDPRLSNGFDRPPYIESKVREGGAD